jgi:hypothetical protein
MVTVSLMLLSPAPVSARQGVTLPVAERQLAACIERTARGRPWLAKTLWGLRDQEGGWVGAAVRNDNGSDDLGPLQVYSWWASRIAMVINRDEADVRRWLRDDACFNVDAARWIFLSALAATRDYWRAIGAFHSSTGWRQRRYVDSVSSHLMRRFGPRVFAKRLAPRAAAAERRTHVGVKIRRL